jgi:hypothetical protein
MPKSASGTVYDATFDTVYDAPSTFIIHFCFVFFLDEFKIFSHGSSQARRQHYQPC